MAQVEVKVSNFDTIPVKRGLHDDGHITLSCSACGEHLVDIWIIKKNAINPETGRVFKWKGKAQCWACGDYSFPKEWEGRFAPGHYGVDVVNPEPDEMNDSKVSSIITRIETKGDMLVFYTAKGK
jgi:hypothetical protein